MELEFSEIFFLQLEMTYMKSPLSPHFPNILQIFLRPPSSTNTHNLRIHCVLTHCDVNPLPHFKVLHMALCHPDILMCKYYLRTYDDFGSIRLSQAL